MSFAGRAHRALRDGSPPARGRGVRSLRGLGALALGALALSGALPAPAPAATGDAVPGRIILELTDAAAKALRAGTLDLPIPVGGEALDPVLRPLFVSRTPPLSRYAILTFHAGRVPDPTGLDREWLDALRTSPEVVRGEPDRVMETSALPDDPYLLGDGGLPNQFDLVNPGGLSLQASRAWPFVPAGRTVTVAIIDSGVDWHHPDLGGPDPPDTGILWVNAAERNGVPGVDDDHNGFVDDVIGWDFVEIDSIPGLTGVAPGEDIHTPDNDPTDYAGHGTQVAGYVNALTDNGIGIAGSAPPARLMVLRVGWRTTDGDALVYMSFCAQALEYAALNGARVANCSWDSVARVTGYDFGLAAALDLAVEGHDMVVVGSAGNANTSSTSIQYVASREDCIGVAGVLKSGVKAFYSNYGSWVDVAAFYQGVPSTFFNVATGEPVYYVHPNGGTSFASPQVAGEAALLRAVAPAADAAQVRSWIRDNVQNLDALNPQYAGMLGGLADYAAAVQAAGGGWDRRIAAGGLTPFTPDGGGAGVAYRSADSVGVVTTAGGLHPGSWAPSRMTAFPPERPPLPAVVAWPDGTELLLWRSGETLGAARDNGPQIPGWPVTVPAGAGEPVAWGAGSDARIYVPAADSVVVLTPNAGNEPAAGSIALPVSTLAVGQLDGDTEPELAGVDAQGTLRVRNPAPGGGAATWDLSLGAISLPPVIAQFSSAAVGEIVVAGPDPAAPDTRQSVHLVAPDGVFRVDASFDAPPLIALSAAGFHGSDLVEAVAVDAAGVIHLVAQGGAVRSVDAGGPVAGEVLCADLDGDWESDLLALRRDGTLLAWDRNLVPLAGFPRHLPAGADEAPLVADSGDRRYVVVADTAGGLWSIPVGPSNRPAPWPMARGNPGRTGYLDHERAVPVEPALAGLTWDAGSVCWTGSGLDALTTLRVSSEKTAEILWYGSASDRGCAAVGERVAGERLALEGAGRSLGWRTLGHVTVTGPAGFRLAPGFPNPFTASTRLDWTGGTGRVRIEIVDVAGRRVASFEAPADAGGFTWNGSDGAGRSLAPGLYFLRATAGGAARVIRVLKLPR